MTQLNRFLGKGFDYPGQEAERTFVAFQCEKGPEGEVLAAVTDSRQHAEPLRQASSGRRTPGPTKLIGVGRELLFLCLIGAAKKRGVSLQELGAWRAINYRAG